MVVRRNRLSRLLLLGSWIYPLGLLFQWDQKVSAREVVATHEWTLLGENDTVAAGMHIRIDLEKGEKWVKLPDDYEEKENREGSAEVSATGGVVLSSRDSSEGDNNGGEEMPNYDFDMMHRTLSKLPEQEKEQIQLPELPVGKSTSSMDPREREVFEKRMTDIWKKRQEQLRKFEEENVADMPEILKDRIQRIVTYLEDPVRHLLEMNLKKDDDEDPEDDSHTVTHIVSALKDLEFQLTDIDMTRDFITLGGWRLLVSLVSDEAHYVSPSNSTLTDDGLRKLQIVQMHAAWALGTAVKNAGEFSPLALSLVDVIGGKKVLFQTTALDLVLRQSSTRMTAMDQVKVSTKRDHKMLYALSSMLRGNRQAQIHFCDADGAILLGTMLARAVDKAPVSKDEQKIVKRLLALADDILQDVWLHPSQPSIDKSIVRKLATDSLCNAALRSLEIESIFVQEKALKMIKSFAAECSWDKIAATNSLNVFRDVLRENEKELDPEFHAELLETVDGALEKIPDLV